MEYAYKILLIHNYKKTKIDSHKTNPDQIQTIGQIQIFPK